MEKKFKETIADLEKRGTLECFGRNFDYYVYNFSPNEEPWKVIHLAIYDDGSIKEMK